MQQTNTDFVIQKLISGGMTSIEAKENEIKNIAQIIYRLRKLGVEIISEKINPKRMGPSPVVYFLKKKSELKAFRILAAKEISRSNQSEILERIEKAGNAGLIDFEGPLKTEKEKAMSAWEELKESIKRNQKTAYGILICFIFSLVGLFFTFYHLYNLIFN